VRENKIYCLFVNINLLICCFYVLADEGLAHHLHDSLSLRVKVKCAVTKIDVIVSVWFVTNSPSL
jgi:hypothetical protein